MGKRTGPISHLCSPSQLPTPTHPHLFLLTQSLPNSRPGSYDRSSSAMPALQGSVPIGSMGLVLRLTRGAADQNSSSELLPSHAFIFQLPLPSFCFSLSFSLSPSCTDTHTHRHTCTHRHSHCQSHLSLCNALGFHPHLLPLMLSL